MRRFPVLSLLLWSAVGCGEGPHHQLPDGPLDAVAQSDLPESGGSFAFGDVDCGTASPPQKLPFHNTGTAPLTWTATIEGNGFAIASGASGTAMPGEAGAIEIAAAVPATVVVGQPITATLKIETNASSEAIEFALSVTPHGGSLHIGSRDVDFGQGQLTEALTQDLDISNLGDRAIDVALGHPANPAFTATWDGAPGAATLEPTAGLPGAVARFQPTTVGMQTDSVPIIATGPVCAGDMPAIAVVGEGTTAPVTVTPPILQFGTTACGSTAQPRQVTIHNAYHFPIQYTAQITSGRYAIAAGQATGTVGANSSATITVNADAVLAEPDSLGANALAGAITVTPIDAPGANPAHLTIAQAASGAVLGLTPNPPATIAFGNVVAGAPASRPYSAKNTGNVAAAVTVRVTGSGFTATTPGGGTVPANGTDTAATVTETVVQRGALTGTLTMSTSTVLCQPAAPGALDLTATGRAPVAVIGAAPAMPATCGVAMPPSVNVSVQNTGDEPLTIPSATATGNFTVLSTFPMTIAVGASASIAVRPPVAQVGVDVAGTVRTGTLSFSTNEIGTPNHSVALSSTVTGAQLALTPNPPATIAFGDVNVGTPVSKPYSVRNNGNLAATVTVATTGPGFSATRPNGGTIPTGGVEQTANVTQTVAQHGALTGTLTVSSNTVQCNAALGVVNLTATGRTPTVVVGTAPPMTSTCGVAAPPSVNVSVQNTGDGPLTIPSATVTGSFVVTSAFPMTIAAGATANMVVQPPPAQVGDTAGSVRTGTLSFATNEIASPNHTVSLSSTVTGAQLVLTPNPPATIAFGDVSVGAPVTRNYSVRNTGNLAATVTVATTGSGFSATRPNGGTIPTGGTDQTGTVTETVAQHGALTGTLTVSSSTAHCTATPGPVNLTATGRTPTAVVGTAPAMPATCGVATPPSVNVSVQNTGDGPLVIPSATATGNFVVTSTLPMTIAPGATANIAVRPPPAVFGTDRAGAVRTGTLSITTNELGNPPRTVSLSSTATGAELVLTPNPPATIAFGDVSVGAPVTRNYSVRNAGNLAATVTVATTGSGFSATRPNGGTIPTGGTDQTATVTETVVQRGALTGTLTVSSNTAQCIATPGAVNLTATGRTPTAVVGTAPAMPATCGVATPPSVNVSVQNTGDGPLVIPSATATGNFVVTSTLPMTIAPGATANIVVRPPPAVLGTDRAGAVRTGTLSITTNEIGNPPRNVSLSSTATGAELVLTPNPPATIAFGDVSVGAPVTRNYSVRNTGNLAATVTVATTGSGFSAVRPNGGTIPTGGTDQTGTVTETVAQHGALTGTLTVSSNTAHCIATPGPVNLTATGRTPTAVVGTAPAMPATCGVATPPSVNVSVQNTGDGPLTIPSATATGNFVVTSTFPMTIAAGATGNISVRPPRAVVGTDRAGAVRTGTLSITTNELGNPPRTVSLSSTANGAELEVTPAPGSTIAFGNVNAGTPVTRNYSVRNTGNVAATVTVATTGPGFSAARPNGGTIPTGGVNQTANATETVAQRGAVTGTLTVSSATAQCTAAPGAVNLTATGRTPTAVIGAVPAMSVTCGDTGTPTAANIPIQNTGDGPLTINATAPAGFMITSTLPMTIAAGGSASLGVRPTPAVIGTDRGGTPRTATLTITTNELTGATHQVALSSAVIGANLRLTDVSGVEISAVTFNTNQQCPAPTTIRVQNFGNAGATVVIANQNFHLFHWGDFSPSAGIAGGSSASHTLQPFTHNDNDVCNGSVTVQYTAISGPVCTAMPLDLHASFTISGQSLCSCG